MKSIIFLIMLCVLPIQALAADATGSLKSLLKVAYLIDQGYTDISLEMADAYAELSIYALNNGDKEALKLMRKAFDLYGKVKAPILNGNEETNKKLLTEGLDNLVKASDLVKPRQ